MMETPELSPRRGDDTELKSLISSTHTPGNSGRTLLLAPVQFRWVCTLLCLHTVIFTGAACAYLIPFRTSYERHLRTELDELREQYRMLTMKNEHLRKSLNEHGQHPYEAITASMGHQLPEMYGKVPEKTIWSYWYHEETCPSSDKCTLPPHIQLCTESVERNKGSFFYKIMHVDEVEKYVSWFELPIHWHDLAPAQQKDSLMNVLLARYGGVGIDISLILLRPFDEYWDEMVNKGATFRGYMYRLNGQPWRHAEDAAVWFVMSRREGIFSIAARNQVMGMGDKNDTGAYHHWYLALGDQTLLPILSMFNDSLPNCNDDPTVKDHSKCPEHELPPWDKGMPGPPRNDTKILLRDPRDGPQLPFAWKGMVDWIISDDTTPLDLSDNGLGAPLHGVQCFTMKGCWEDVFLARYNAPAPIGQARLINMVKLFNHGAELDGKSREEMLSNRSTYFYNWLKLAGHPAIVD